MGQGQMNGNQQIHYLEHELRKVRAENTYLRDRLKETSRHERRVQQAYEDALLLITWHIAGIIPSRRYAALHRISQRRWQNALGLLRMARVVKRRRHWTASDLASAESRLQQARQRAIESPEAFFARLNRHALS